MGLHFIVKQSATPEPPLPAPSSPIDDVYITDSVGDDVIGQQTNYENTDITLTFNTGDIRQLHCITLNIFGAGKALFVRNIEFYNEGVWEEHFDNTQWSSLGGFSWVPLSAGYGAAGWYENGPDGHLQELGTWNVGYRPTKFRVYCTIEDNDWFF
jgi:hypothetical protein